MRKTVRALSPFCLLLIAVIALSYAQQAAPSSSQAPQSGSAAATEPVYRSATVLKYTTRLILVDVIATDHKGEPLPDLKAEDFVLTEDGTKQDIRVFEFQSSANTAPAKPLPKLPANVITNAPR